MSWIKAGDAAKRTAMRLRPDNDDDTPPMGGSGEALQGRPHEFESDRDDRSELRREPHAPRSRIGRATLAQGPRPDCPSEAPTADRGKAISRRLPIREIGQFVRRMVTDVIQRRRGAVQRAELNLDLAQVAEFPASPAPAGALTAGREAGRQVGV